jgi:thiamine-phosphate pyrophosphorylase
MTSSPAARGRMNVPRLYLVTPALGDTAAFARSLDAALAAGDVAAILLRLEAADEHALINRAKAIAAVVQRRDIALLLDGRAEIAARAGADGAHLSGIEALTAALGTLKPDRIAGAGGLRSRHDAMLAGEANADYVMFGEPPPYPRAHAGEDREGSARPPLDALVERLTWWAELFEQPCVGYAANLDEVAPLARAGADFVALGDWIWTNELNPAAAIAAAAERLAETSSSPAARGR